MKPACALHRNAQARPNSSGAPKRPVGTCAMGSEATSVTTPDLRVRGVDALRIVDASVMPLVPSGNTTAAVLMIAERAADLVLGHALERSEDHVAAAPA